MPEKKKYLNLGCGSRFHPDWINIDLVSHKPQVICHNICQGLPLPDESCDVVYNAALLEHLRHSDATDLLIECHRVLKPDGIIRVGVPDLEKICRIYLFKLNAALKGDEVSAHDYDWIMLELFDQITREKSGGDMLAYLQQDPIPNESFVYERIGEEGRQLVKKLRKDVDLRGNSFLVLLRNLINGLYKLPKTLRYRTLRCLLGEKDRKALEIGHFRLSGEIHQWMYDRYSLAQLLKKTGFHDPQLQNAHTSQIIGWEKFNLDTLPNGKVIKPDLFFMEAKK